jgi:hypothetical protein
MPVSMNIICNNEANATAVANQVRCVDLFRGARVEEIFKTYPNESDQHRTLRVVGTAKAVHAVRVLAWTVNVAEVPAGAFDKPFRASEQVQPRKITVFFPCEKHAWRMSSETRERRAELMVEGGWAGEAPCNCQMKPGLDFFTTAFVSAHPDGCGIQGRAINAMAEVQP